MRSTVHPCGIDLETLEPRRLMSVSASISNGVLVVQGSESSDRIILRQRSGALSIEGVGSVAASLVRAIAINARGGNDTVVLLNPALEAGNDYITRSTLIVGGTGHDLITGGAESDLILGGDGNDAIYGTWGNDIAIGGYGADAVYGGSGADVLLGSEGNDTLYGGAQNDLIIAGAGYDSTSGERGTNIIIDDIFGQRLSNPWGYDVMKFKTLSYTVPSLFRNVTATSLSDLTQATPVLGSQPQTYLQSLLGPQLYDGIFVSKTIPNYFRSL